MATAIVMPKQGNSVESCIIVEWKKKIGDRVEIDEALCDVETDKTTMEVPSPVAGILLATFFKAGDDVPVMINIAAIGAVGEDVSLLNPNQEQGRTGEGEKGKQEDKEIISQSPNLPISNLPIANLPIANLQSPISSLQSPVSPRARALAERKGIDVTALAGSGPEGRIIERDIQAAIVTQPKLTPIAKAMIAEGGYALPAQGTGPGGRVTSKDLVEDKQIGKQADREIGRQRENESVNEQSISQSPNLAISDLRSPISDEVTSIPVKGVRKVIAERMLASLQTTAQLTMNTSADARALRALRERFKTSPEGMGLRNVSINDLVLFAVSRSLIQHPNLNALFTDNTISQYKRVHLGFAVDTPRGLLVPVIRNADLLTLKQIAAESKRLAQACLDNKVTLDELNGGTFTISNLGAFGVETFTPVLNPPQVAILGVGGIGLKPIEVNGGGEHIPHLSLSLTINHQVVDGAPAARFLQTLVQAISQVDLLLAG